MPLNDVKLHIPLPARDVADVTKRKTSTSRVTLNTSRHNRATEERVEFSYLFFLGRKKL